VPKASAIAISPISPIGTNADICSVISQKRTTNAFVLVRLPRLFQSSWTT
jgi:hypothetical protein